MLLSSHTLLRMTTSNVKGKPPITEEPLSNFSSTSAFTVSAPESASGVRTSGSSNASVDESKADKKRATLSMLAALHAFKMENSMGFNIMTNADHFFLMRTTSRPPHLSAAMLRAKGLHVYEVLNQLGHRLYFAVVFATQCLKMFWRCPNNFTAHIVDTDGDEIVKIEADSGLFGRHSVVEVKGSEPFGFIKQEGDCCTPDFTLESAKGDPLLKVRPSHSVNCFNLCTPVDYVVYHGELAHKVGYMNTHWHNTGVLPELFHSPNIKLYGVKFPLEMDTTTKVLLLSTLVMVKIFRNEF